MDIRALYQEVIMDHNRHPRNHHVMVHKTNEAQGYNPLCGDQLTVYLNIQNNIIEDASFVGCGCAISQASASLMTEALKGRTVEEAHTWFHQFHEMLTEDKPIPTTLNKLVVLAGVKTYPARVKCATLAWHTLEAALKQCTDCVTTESTC